MKRSSSILRSQAPGHWPAPVRGPRPGPEAGRGVFALRTPEGTP